MEMDARKMYLSKLHEYIDGVDKEVTMILQSLQWDRKTLLEDKATTSCKYDSGHKIPVEKLELHEKECALKSLKYSENDKLLPDLLDPDAKTVVKLSSQDITNIIEKACQSELMFKKVNLFLKSKVYILFGEGSRQSEPLSLERLQVTYTSDERRAIHDAVVQAVPSSHDLSDLALTSSNSEDKGATKSRLEILADLRDMKRRRTKYRVATKSKNYSDVLRDVIKTQMEVYSETQAVMSQNDNDNTRTKYQDIDNKPNYNDTIIKQEPRDDRTHNKHKTHSKHRTKHDEYKKARTESDHYKNASKYPQPDDKSSKTPRNDYVHKSRNRGHDDRNDKSKYKDKYKYEADRYSEHKDKKRHGDDYTKREHSYKDRREKEKYREESSSRSENRVSKRYSEISRHSRKYEKKDEEQSRKYDTTDFKHEY